MSGPVRSGRRRRLVAVVLLLAVFVAAVVASQLLLTSDPGRTATRRVPPSATAAASPRGTVARILDRAVANPDGSLSVEVSAPETTTLVRAGLARSGAPAVEDVRVELVEPDGAASGRMVLDGRLSEQRLPFRAIIDLAVRDGSVVPTVRDVRVGPLPVPASVRDELNRELTRRTSTLDAGLELERLSTADGVLRLRGRRP